LNHLFPTPYPLLPIPYFMAQFWIVFFFILLAVAELYQSVKDIVLPFPVYLVLGSLLAVASNYQQQISAVQNQRVTLQEIVEPVPILAEAKSPLLIADNANNDTESANI
jgi:hypothetical protein